MDFTPSEAANFPLILAVPSCLPCDALQVFNLNAPVPPASETEALNQASQYQNSYNQAFSSQSQHPAEQTEMQSEQLQSGGHEFWIFPSICLLICKTFSFIKIYFKNNLNLFCFVFVCIKPLVFLVVGAFHSQEQSGGHQQQPSQQGPGFGRQPQSFYNSRGMSRGGPRNPRGMINGYRGSSNGFRGRLETHNHQ